MFSTLFRGRKPAPSVIPAAPQLPAAQIDPSDTFARFRLKPEVIRGAEAAGYQQPTPIQRKAIPLVLSGRDLIGSAQTGTGKTAAFALPILSLLDHHQPRRQGKESGCRVLVLEPTRELALQVTANFQDYAQVQRSAHDGDLRRGRLWQTARRSEEAASISSWPRRAG